MTEPLIVRSTYAVDGARLEELTTLVERVSQRLDAGDTRPLAFGFYVSNDGLEVSGVQVHADAASLDACLPAAHEMLVAPLGPARTTCIEVFGRLGPAALEVVRRSAELGAHVTLKPRRVGGDNDGLAAQRARRALARRARRPRTVA